MLSFIWTAKFKDGSYLKQFNEQNKEILFKEVLNRFSNLLSFTITHINNNFSITVNLQSGIIKVNNNEIEINNERKNNIRLIYFRRISEKINLKIKKIIINPIIYFIGYQYNNEDGNNKKIIFEVDKDCNYIRSIECQ